MIGWLITYLKGCLKTKTPLFEVYFKTNVLKTLMRWRMYTDLMPAKLRCKEHRLKTRKPNTGYDYGIRFFTF